MIDTTDLIVEHEALLQFMYLAPVGLLQMKNDGEIVMINPLSSQLLMPVSPDGELSNLFRAIDRVAPELRNLCASYKKARGRICDGHRVHLTAGIPGIQDAQVLSFTLLKLDANHIMAVISDISLSIKRERQLQQNEAWFNAISSGLTEYAMMNLDHNGCVQSWNVSLERLLKYPATETEGKPFSIFFSAEALNEDRMQDRLAEAGDNGWSLVEGWCIRKDGSKFWASTIIAPLDDTLNTDIQDRHYAMIIRDISDTRNSAELLLKASLNDHLTGIPNRRAFFEAASKEYERWVKRARHLSLLEIDADHFKKVNDTYGHPAGDEVLKHLSQMLLAAIREMDMAARLGGEEFAVLLPSTDVEGAAKIAERIRQSIADAVLTIDGKEIRYTVSIGVSTMTESVTGIDMLLKLADDALYRAKHSGRNCVVIDAGQNA